MFIIRQTSSYSMDSHHRTPLPPLVLIIAQIWYFFIPLVSLIDRCRGIQDDLTLDPRDCWMLWKAMDKHKIEEYPVDRSLDVSFALPSVVKKADIIKLETLLKALLRQWMAHATPPFELVINELSGKPMNSSHSRVQVSSSKYEETADAKLIKKGSILDTILPLICYLHYQHALPTMIFNYDRTYCEETCENAEDRWKAEIPVWKKRLAGWKEWQKAEFRRVNTKQPRKQKSRVSDEEEKTSQLDHLIEAASKDSNSYESFDPNDPVPGFHFADEKTLTPSELYEYATELGYRAVPKWMMDALKRGIGVHHSALDRKYRQGCEMLFKKGYLRVVIATGTLALAINMPCKTVVFSGDSVYLTPCAFVRQLIELAAVDSTSWAMLSSNAFHKRKCLDC